MTPLVVADSGLATLVVADPADMPFVVLVTVGPVDKKTDIPVVAEPGVVALLTLEGRKHAGKGYSVAEFANNAEMFAVPPADLVIDVVAGLAFVGNSDAAADQVAEVGGADLIAAVVPVAEINAG